MTCRFFRGTRLGLLAIFSILLLIAGSNASAFAQSSIQFLETPSQVWAFEDTPSQVFSFKVSGGSGRITVVGRSSNTALVRDENILISQVNGVWQLVAVPSADRHGKTTITLTAQDAGTASGQTSFLMDVFPLNDPPSIQIISPLDGKQFQAPATVELVADAKDVDGNDTVMKVEFFGDGQSLAVVTRRPFTVSWGPVSRGTYTLTAVATDDAGIKTVSNPVKIDVILPLGLPPGQRAGPEGDDPVTIIPLQRLSVIGLPLKDPLVVEYYTTNRSALGGVLAVGGIDYVPKRGRWVFLPGGNTTTNLDVEVLGNTSDDYDRSFEVRWHPLSDVTLATTNVVVTILDDDPPPRLVLSNSELRVNEGNPGAAASLLTLVLVPPSGKVVEVQFSSANGTAVAGRDYVPLNPIDNYVRFQPRQSQVTITNLVKLIDNSFNDPNRDYFIDVQVEPTFAILDPSQSRIHVTIVDDDPLPTLAIRPTAGSDVVEGNSGVTNAVFSVSLTPQSGRSVTVQYATTQDGNATSGVDFRVASGTLTFQPGETNKNVVVEVLGDLLHEGTESFFVALSNPMNATVLIPQAQGRIFDDEAAPVISIQDATFVQEGNTGSTNATFQVTLSAASAQIVTVNFTTSSATALAGTDFAGKTNIVTFSPGGPLVQSIAVEVIGDNLSEPDETFIVNLSDPVGATLGRNHATGTITDDDMVIGISITDAAISEPDLGFTNMVFNVSLSAASSEVISVAYVTLDNTAQAEGDYASAFGILTFPPGVTNHTIAVRVHADLVHEVEENFLVLLSEPKNAVILHNRAVGTITDNERLPAISISDVVVTEGNQGTVSANFVVSLSAASAKPVSVTVTTVEATATAGRDFQPATATVTFLPNTTSLTVSVPVIGDTEDEPPETFSMLLSNPVNATLGNARGLCTIIDDDMKPEAPTITAQAKSQTVLVGTSAALSVSATGTPPLNYQWRFNQKDILSATNAILTFDKVTLAESGEYSVVISNATGTATSTSATLAVVIPSPANDNIANATKVSGISVTVEGTNVNASREAAELDHAGRPGGRSVWWSWTAALSGKATIETAGSTFDTLLAVYSGTGITSLTRIAENDDDPAGGKTSRVSLSVRGGETYLIAVDGFAGDSGSIKLAIALTDTVGPSIRIERSGNNVVISWAVSPAGFAVESTDSLGTLSNWIELKQAPVVFGNRNILKLDAPNGSLFYRLRLR